MNPIAHYLRPVVFLYVCLYHHIGEIENLEAADDGVGAMGLDGREIIGSHLHFKVGVFTNTEECLLWLFRSIT